MTAKHTPGPWRVGPYYRHEVVSDHGVITCASIETEQTRADARLIAAAPELLEALISITEQLERVGDDRKDAPFIEAAQKAIAKAEGA